MIKLRQSLAHHGGSYGAERLHEAALDRGKTRALAAGKYVANALRELVNSVAYSGGEFRVCSGQGRLRSDSVGKPVMIEGARLYKRLPRRVAVQRWTCTLSCQLSAVSPERRTAEGCSLRLWLIADS